MTKKGLQPPKKFKRAASVGKVMASVFWDSEGVMIVIDYLQKAQVSVAAATQCGFELLPHPPYSPDLAPSDFYLFPNLKSHLHGHHFETDDEVIHAVEAYPETQDATYFQQGVRYAHLQYGSDVTGPNIAEYQ
ncbi:SETMAR [Branchiostoma lanceolatum]|uniref:SETMAR protein n=1 Tax=Branchiostoma lanceolatum TaxID=7740 RepID=A0A8J9Z916_BRALA|nr:SETMAR [Branchiostoma lanceolatum]